MTEELVNRAEVLALQNHINKLEAERDSKAAADIVNTEQSDAIAARFCQVIADRDHWKQRTNALRAELNAADARLAQFRATVAGFGVDSALEASLNREVALQAQLNTERQIVAVKTAEVSELKAESDDIKRRASDIQSNLHKQLDAERVKTKDQKQRASELREALNDRIDERERLLNDIDIESERVKVEAANVRRAENKVARIESERDAALSIRDAAFAERDKWKRRAENMSKSDASRAVASAFPDGDERPADTIIVGESVAEGLRKMLKEKEESKNAEFAFGMMVAIASALASLSEGFAEAEAEADQVDQVDAFAETEAAEESAESAWSTRVGPQTLEDIADGMRKAATNYAATGVEFTFDDIPFTPRFRAFNTSPEVKKALADAVKKADADGFGKSPLDDILRAAGWKVVGGVNLSPEAFKARWNAAKEVADDCTCPACTLRRKLEAKARS